MNQGGSVGFIRGSSPARGPIADGIQKGGEPAPPPLGAPEVRMSGAMIAANPGHTVLLYGIQAGVPEKAWMSLLAP
jgi:hypothetical protein